MKSHYLKHAVLTIKLTIICLVFSFFSSCSSDESGNNDGGANGNYYVKYVIKGNGTYGRFSNWTATKPQGKFTNNGHQVRSWSQTYGPVDRGFNCEVKIGDYISGPPTIEIYVSKNEEPFALKISKTGGTASYTID